MRACRIWILNRRCSPATDNPSCLFWTQYRRANAPGTGLSEKIAVLPVLVDDRDVLLGDPLLVGVGCEGSRGRPWTCPRRTEKRT